MPENDTDNINADASEAAKQMEGQDLADPNKPGLIEAMNMEFDGEPAAPSKAQDDAAAALGGDDAPIQDDTQDAPKEEPKDDPKEEPKTDPEIEIDEEFFSDEEGKDEKKEDEPSDASFDENQFDAETAAVLKALEEKGHPGDVYKKVREELKEAKMSTVTPEQQKEIDDLRLKAEEAEGLRERLDELSNQSAKLKVENSDAYANEVLKPAEKIFERAEELAAQYEGDAEVIKNIIRTRDRKAQNELISDQLQDMSDFDRNEVYRMVQDFGRLVDKREMMMEDAEKSIEQIEAQRIAEENAQRAEMRKNVQTIQKDMWSKYEDKIPGLLDEDGNQTPEFKKLMAKGMSIDFSKAQGRDQAYASFAGVVLPYIVKQMNALKSELAEYQDADSKASRKSASPGSTVTPAAKGSEEEPEGLLARMANVDLV